MIALPSVHPKAGVSTVVPLLEAPATSVQHSHIVSEQGVATVRGCDQGAQARQLVDHVAHPSVRDGLREAAVRLGLPFDAGRSGGAGSRGAGPSV